MRHWMTDPLRELEVLREELFRTFDSLAPQLPRLSFLPGVSARCFPLLNMAEEPERILVQALAPGLQPESLQISVTANKLSIAGEKAAAAKGIKPEAWHRNERAAGRFVRTVELPVEVDADRVQAHYRNGILEIVLPKAENARPRMIQVKVN